jgi:hypothetical protein
MTLFFLLIYFIIITVVIEIHALLFQLTGLKEEISRFQVISLMTGTGFTTGESELILGHPVRRKLAAFLILFGAFSLAVIISSISNFLSNELHMKEILAIAGGVLLVFAVLKLKWMRKRLSKLFSQEMKHKVELADLPLREVFLKNKEDCVLNLHVYEKSLAVLGTLKSAVGDRDIVVLLIMRGEVVIRKKVYDTPIHGGDQILLFGNRREIFEVFQHDIKIMEEMLANREPSAL